MRRVSNATKRAWTESTYRESIVPYCFGDLDADEHEAVERHLFECDGCWRTLQQLEGAVSSLRSDRRTSAGLRTAETLTDAVFGERKDAPFQAHGRFALLASLGVAATFAAGIWTELVYAFDRFGNLAMWLSATVLLGVFGAMLLTLRLMSARPVRQMLLTGIGGITLTSAMLLAACAVLLPHEQTIAASITTRTAFVGYLKNVMSYLLPMTIGFVLLPFHVVLALERELIAGRHDAVRALLASSSLAAAPARVVFIRPAVLGAALLGSAAVGVFGANYLLDALQVGPYAGLFTVALYGRILLWIATAAIGVWWYAVSLDDIKRLLRLTAELNAGRG
jgi:anti-sigma factor RsiW